MGLSMAAVGLMYTRVGAAAVQGIWGTNVLGASGLCNACTDALSQQ